MLSLWLIAVLGAESSKVLEGTVPDDGVQFMRVPFEVPAGTREVEVRHDDLSGANILDWGLVGPDGGVRGWGGGSSEPAIISEGATSRGYLLGPVDPGTWSVLVGKAKVPEQPARYRIEVVTRDAPTLAAQPERVPYVAVPALRPGPAWYAGDLHVHDTQSTDARATISEITALAARRGLDFVALSDHNTTAQLDFFALEQPRAAGVLLVPSVEFTTYAGHANAFGATRFVPFHFGLDGWTYAQALDAFAAQGAVLTINHPTLDLGPNCIGCGWEQPVVSGRFGAIELGVGGWDTSGGLFDEPAIAYWESLADRGLHLAAVGGSDDHRGGTDPTSSPVGDPTTLIHASELSVSALVDGLRAARTVVKLRGPSDPMIELEATGARMGDTIVGTTTTLTAKVTGGGDAFRWVINGVPRADEPVTGGFTSSLVLNGVADASLRARAEVLVSGKPRTVTSLLWLSPQWPPLPPKLASRAPASCGCDSSGALLLPALLALASVARRQAQHRQRARQRR